MTVALGYLNARPVGFDRFVVTPELEERSAQATPTIPLVVRLVEVSTQLPDAVFDPAGLQVFECYAEPKSRIVGTVPEHALECFEPTRVGHGAVSPERGTSGSSRRSAVRP